MTTIAVTSEGQAEPRFAVSPETVKKLKALGCTIRVETGAGSRSRFSDAAFAAAGADITKTAAETLSGADILLKVRRPSADEMKALKPGALVAAMISPHDDRANLDTLAATGMSLFSMEFMPRITRAQSMDVLSSQANLAGYKAVIDAAAMFEQAMKKKNYAKFPKLITIIWMLMLQASQNTTFTRNNLNLLQQKQPKISLKAHFFKNWLASKLGR